MLDSEGPESVAQVDGTAARVARVTMTSRRSEVIAQCYQFRGFAPGARHRWMLFHTALVDGIVTEGSGSMYSPMTDSSLSDEVGV